MWRLVLQHLIHKGILLDVRHISCLTLKIVVMSMLSVPGSFNLHKERAEPGG